MNSTSSSDGSFHLVELCCGSAALTQHLIGATRQITPYQGSKWKFRHELKTLLVERGHTKLSAVTLNDIGPWGPTWYMLTMEPRWIINEIVKLSKEDPRAVYDRLNGSTTPSTEDPAFAAQFLFLQRLSFSGKAVGLQGLQGREGDALWKSPGFNKTSAYWTALTSRFGQIKPLLPSLVRVLKQLQALPWPKSVRCSSKDAILVIPGEAKGLPLVAYLDPNYQESTGYPNGALSREEVIAMAKKWHKKHNATVLVSEAEPIAELVEEGWEARCIRQSTIDGKPFQSKASEWVTMSPRPL